MSSTIVFRRGTTATALLASGEPGFNTLTNQLYVGTGSTNILIDPATPPPTPPTSVFRETPSGSVDGTNTNFNLANAPITNTDCVYLNGVLQEPGGSNDYTLSFATVTFNAAPQVGDIVRISYQY